MVEKRNQFLLARLAEDNSVGRKLPFQSLERRHFARVGEHRHLTYHTVRTRCDPSGNEVVLTVGARRLLGKLEDRVPEIVANTPGPYGVSSVACSDVAANGVPLVSVNTTFPLFQVDGIAREVPVNEAVAPGMKVESLLPDGRAGEDEGAKRAVERVPHRVLTEVSGLLVTNVAEAKRKHRTNAHLVTLHCTPGRPEEPCVNS